MAASASATPVKGNTSTAGYSTGFDDSLAATPRTMTTSVPMPEQIRAATASPDSGTYAATGSRRPSGGMVFGNSAIGCFHSVVVAQSSEMLPSELKSGTSAS